jgi:hypothetical protein
MKVKIKTKKPDEMESALQKLQKNFEERMDELTSHNANLVFAWTKKVEGDMTIFETNMIYTGQNFLIDRFIKGQFEKVIKAIDSEARMD